MEKEEIELAIKRLAQLEKRIELYYQMLKIDNELGFILNGTYVLDADIDAVLKGNY